MHFLTAAPGRTPQRLTNRLPADGRSSLGKAFPAELPVQRIYLPYLYHSWEKLARGNLSAAGRKRRKTGGGTAVPPPTGSIWRSAPEGLHQLRVGIVTDVDAPGDILQTDIPHIVAAEGHVRLRLHGVVIGIDDELHEAEPGVLLIDGSLLYTSSAADD